MEIEEEKNRVVRNARVGDVNVLKRRGDKKISNIRNDDHGSINIDITMLFFSRIASTMSILRHGIYHSLCSCHRDQVQRC